MLPRQQRVALTDQRQLWDSWADDYDDSFLGREDPSATVTGLLELCRGKRVLELGVGTGRVAIELARAGVRVDGVDVSPKMIAILERKAADLPVTPILGDMAEVSTGRSYPVVYMVYSALLLLQSQREQVRCFANVARALEPGGVLAIEATHPQAFFRNNGLRTVAVRDLTDDTALLSATIVDPIEQRVRFHEIDIRGGSLRQLPCDVRYVWPAEMDLMAEMAGLRLTRRSEGWNEAPLTPHSRQHVSIYEKVEA